MSVSMTEIKKLREETGAGIMDAKKALEESKGDMAKARKWIVAKGIQKAEKKADRETKAGVVFAYTHHNNQSATLVELLCETDFVAKTDEFLKLAKEVSLQVNSMNPKDVGELLAQEYNRDSSMSIEQLVKQVSGKVGEKIEVKRFVRLAVGEAES